MKMSMKNTFAEIILMIFLFLTQSIGDDTTSISYDDITTVSSSINMMFANHSKQLLSGNKTDQRGCMGCVEVSNSNDNGTYCVCNDGTTQRECRGCVEVSNSNDNGTSCVCNDGTTQRECRGCVEVSNSNDNGTSCVCNDGTTQRECRGCVEVSNSNDNRTSCVCNDGTTQRECRGCVEVFDSNDNGTSCVCNDGTTQRECRGCVEVSNSNDNGTSCVCNDGTTHRECRGCVEVFDSNDNGSSCVCNDGTTQRECRGCVEVFDSSSNGTSCVCNDGTNANKTKGSSDFKIIGFIVVPVFFTFGVIGNALTIRVMLSRKFRSRSSSMILLALAVSDTIFSCSVPFNKKLVRNIIGWDVRSLSRVGCSLFYIILKTSKTTSSWLVVFISLERFIAVCFPLKIKFICTKRNTLVGMTCLCSFLLIFNGLWDFSNDIVNGICTTIYGSIKYVMLSQTYLMTAIALNSILPAIIVMVLTFITVTQLVRQSRLRRRMTITNQRTDDTFRTTTMLIGVSISFLVLVTPMGIAHNVSFGMGDNFFETHDKDLALTREILQTLGQLNFSINFLLYVMCSKEFRKKVASIIGLNYLRRAQKSSSCKGKTSVTTNTYLKGNSQYEARTEEPGVEQEQLRCEMQKF